MNLNFVDEMLCCPACAHVNLHHERVEVFERSEDDERGVHVVVDGVHVSHVDASDASVKVDMDLTGNPSSRRNGLLVHFYCEMCSWKSVLSLYQHKGATFLELKKSEEVSDE